MKYCSKCGKEINENDNFFNNCGTEQNNIQNMNNDSKKGQRIVGIVFIVLQFISYLAIFNINQLIEFIGYNCFLIIGLILIIRSYSDKKMSTAFVATITVIVAIALAAAAVSLVYALIPD